MNKTLARLALFPALIAGCSSADSPVNGPGEVVSVKVAPLILAGLSDACYGLTVFNGDPAVADTVWHQSNICASQYGDQVSDISYVGPCDAAAAGNNTIRLVIERLEAGGATLYDQTNAPNGDPDFVNPCPASTGGCVQDFPCLENQDTFVELNLTVMRDAKQGFFDVAIDFDDIFCSAKLDCVDDDDLPIELVHDPVTGERGPSLIATFACTSGGPTCLVASAPRITCTDTGPDPDEEVSFVIDPTHPGNAVPDLVSATDVYNQYVVFQGQEFTDTPGLADKEKQYWNLAVGLNYDPLSETMGASGNLTSCTFTWEVTAGDSPAILGGTPVDGLYPVIVFDAPLNDTAGKLTCGQHELGSAEVLPTYVGPPSARPPAGPFHGVKCADPTPAAKGAPDITWPSDGGSLQDAVTNVVDGGTVFIEAGDYDLPAPLLIADKEVHLRGADCPECPGPVIRQSRGAGTPVAASGAATILRCTTCPTTFEPDASLAEGVIQLAGGSGSISNLGIAGSALGPAPQAGIVVSDGARSAGELTIDRVSVGAAGRAVIVTSAEDVNILNSSLGSSSASIGWSGLVHVNADLVGSMYLYNTVITNAPNMCVFDNGGLTWLDHVSINGCGTTLAANGGGVGGINGAKLILTHTSVQNTTGFGVVTHGSTSVISNSLILNVDDYPPGHPLPGLWGDGLAAFSSPYSAVIGSTINLGNPATTNGRAGVAAIGSDVSVTDSNFLCAAFDFNPEAFLGVDGHILDGGGVVCGCPSPDSSCHAVSAGFSPPALLTE